MAQAMGMGEQAAQRARVEPSPARGDEEGVLRPPYEARAPVLEVTAQPVRSFLAQRNDALFVALALHAHCLLLEVDVSEIEPDRLRAAQAGRVVGERRRPDRVQPLPAFPQPTGELVEIDAVGATGRVRKSRALEKPVQGRASHGPGFALTWSLPARNSSDE